MSKKWKNAWVIYLNNDKKANVLIPNDNDYFKFNKNYKSNRKIRFHK